MNLQLPGPELRALCIDTIKFLAVDAIEQARSGHPGACMGAADPAFVLWTRFLRVDPTRPDWADRDRFVLSAGHASMLLYSLMHLDGFDLGLDELKRFRQLHSRAAGHPEYGLLPGVETTTGPLGQGFATGVGMALSGRMAAARYNRGGAVPVGFRVFALCGDGDMMEGITTEAASLAGHLGLGNLVYLYDSNRITIEGSTDLSFREDVAGRFRSLGWHVEDVDGYDPDAVAGAIQAGIDAVDRPSLVVCRTEIGHGAPTLHGTARTHGAPLGADEVRAAKDAAGWPTDRTFHVPDEVRDFFRGVAAAGTAARLAWEQDFDAWRAAHPDLAARWDASARGTTFEDLAPVLAAATAPARGKATRVVGNKALQAAVQALPNLVGGSADLGPSNETVLAGRGDVAPGAFEGANLHFGIREHAMAAAVNGMAIHGAFRPYGATFLVFSDYLKPSLRLAALMKVPSIFVFSHDSFCVGEDGPTHQPIEHLWMLRSIPGLTVFRPCDDVETAGAWAHALSRKDGPTCVVTTRQAIPPVDRPAGLGPECVLSGGYVMREADGGAPDLVLVATGSEVSACAAALPTLAAAGIRARLVSMPSVERFLDQGGAYRAQVLPPGVPVVTVEAGSTVGWYRFAGTDGLAIGLDRFGESAPAEVLVKEFGFDADGIARRILAWRGLGGGV